MKKLLEKTGLHTQNYRDRSPLSISASLFIIGRAALRLTATLASILPATNKFVHDIGQAYVQSQFKVEKLVFTRSPQEMRLGPSRALLVTELMFRIPEGELEWFTTHFDRQRKEFSVKSTREDLGSLYESTESDIAVDTALKSDDFFSNGNGSIFDAEVMGSRKFKGKQRRILKKGNHVELDGCTAAAHDPTGYNIMQTGRKSKLTSPAAPKYFLIRFHKPRTSVVAPAPTFVPQYRHLQASLKIFSTEVIVLSKMLLSLETQRRKPT